MSIKMTKPQIMRFVKLYRDNSCLWDVNSEYYKDREARDNALKSISDQMGIPNFGPREVSRKIKNVRTTYCQQLKKVAKSRDSGVPEGDVFKPTLPWFKIADSIFRKPDRGSILNSPSVSDSEIYDLNFVKEEPLEDESNLSDIPEDSLNEESIYCSDTAYSHENPAELNYQIHTQNTCSPQQVRSETTNTSIENAIQRLEGIVKMTLQSEDTEYDLFAQYIASALKGLPAENAITVQTEIMQLIAKEKRKVIHEKSLNFVSL